MAASCQQCGCAVDASRSSARIVHARGSAPRFEYLCPTCVGSARSGRPPSPRLAAHCCDCAEEVSPSSAVPVLVAGSFRLRCPNCASAGTGNNPAPHDSDNSDGSDRLAERRNPPPPVPGRPAGARSRSLMAIGAVAAGVAAAVVSADSSVAERDPKPPATPQIVALEPDSATDDDVDMEFADVALAPADTPLAHELSVPADFTFEEWKRGLLDTVVWYHPIAGKRRRLPTKRTRRFGAKRPPSRPECGEGHCGVDVGFKRGLVVHTASFGTVDRISLDADSRSGRYVKIVHPSGYATWYMHLEHIRHDLQKGVEVGAGEAVGTVGRTGIKKSEAHLHFAVSKEHNGREFFIDPEPMLRQAIVLEEPAPIRSRFNH